jgi:flagellar protein FliS
MKENLKTYQIIDSAGKSAPELLAKIYRAAITNMQSAIEAYNSDDFNAGYENLEKAKTIIVRLYTVLDNEKGGEIADKLGQLYTFLIEKINFVQATKNNECLSDLIKILENILEGWAELAAQMKTLSENEPSDEKLPKRQNISVSV